MRGGWPLGPTEGKPGTPSLFILRSKMLFVLVSQPYPSALEHGGLADAGVVSTKTIAVRIIRVTMRHSHPESSRVSLIIAIAGLTSSLWTSLSLVCVISQVRSSLGYDHSVLLRLATNHLPVGSALPHLIRQAHSLLASRNKDGMHFMHCSYFRPMLPWGLISFKYSQMAMEQ